MATTYRATMADLIARVRIDIGDAPGLTQQFTDVQIQDALDLYRTDYINDLLVARPTYSGGTILYLNYYSNGITDWESDYTLWQYLYHQVTDDTTQSEPLTGHWVFAATTLPPIFIRGKAYDVNLANWKLCMRWASVLARQYNFTSDGQSFSRNQAYQAMVNQANIFKKQARIKVGSLVRSDLAGDAEMSDHSTAIDYQASGDGR